MAKTPEKSGNQYSNKHGKRKETAPAIVSSVSLSIPVRQAQVAAPAPKSETSATMVSTTQPGAQTLQQERAAYALTSVREAVAAIKDSESKKRKEFRSYAASFPAMIQMNGLGQAAAFYFSQGETYKTLYDILSVWLIKPHQPYCGEVSLLDGITGQDLHAYRVAQAEALLLLDWVKKFAKAYVREE